MITKLEQAFLSVAASIRYLLFGDAERTSPFLPVPRLLGAITAEALTP